MIDRLYIKIADWVDKEFVVEAEVELCVLKVVLVDGIDEVDKSDRVNKHKKIALLWQGTLVAE